jgi:hypothetical protein
LGDINTGISYLKTYDKLVKNHEDMLLPCVLAIDKTTCNIGGGGRLTLVPIVFSYGLMKHDIRKTPAAMRVLGFINTTPMKERDFSPCIPRPNTPLPIVVHFQFLNTTDELACQIGQDGKLPKTCILLGNQSTVDVLCSGDLLTDIRENPEYMKIHCNAGIATTNLIGDLTGYGPVWYHHNGIANILSLSRVKEHRYHVTYESNGGNRCIVTKSNGGTFVFEESERGLFYLDTVGTTKKSSTVMVNTVADNNANFSNCAYARAVLAWNIQNFSRTLG